MRISIAQARQLGISEEYIRQAEEHGRVAERSRVVREDLDLAAARPKRMRPADGMNKTERAFAEMLGRYSFVESWAREPLKFRLAGKTYYTPDFVVWTEPVIGQRAAWCVEIKGFMRDDAAVKIKVAAAQYPEFRWLLVRRAGRHGWEVRGVDRSGIGREPVSVPWIGGGP